MQWLLNFNIYIQGIIIFSAILLFTIIQIIFIFIFKRNIKKKNLKLFSAFTAGILITSALIGQMVSARDSLISNYETINSSQGKINVSLNWSQNLSVILAFIIGIVLAFLIILIINFIHNKSAKKEIHNKSILVVIVHRFPAGISMGGLIYSSNQLLPNGMLVSPVSLATLLTFIIHIIPETLFAHYTKMRKTNNSFKTNIFTFTSLFLFLPLILMGILIFQSIPNDFSYFKDILFITAGSIIIWGVIFELIPQSFSEGYNKYVLISLTSGIALSLFLQIIHIH